MDIHLYNGDEGIYMFITDLYFFPLIFTYDNI